MAVPGPTAPAPDPTFAEAAKAMARTKTGAQVGRFVRLYVAALAALVVAQVSTGQPIELTRSALTPLAVAALETAYRQFKAPTK